MKLLCNLQELENLRGRFTQEKCTFVDQLRLLNQTVEQISEAKETEKMELEGKISSLELDCRRLLTNMETKDNQILSLQRKIEAHAKSANEAFSVKNNNNEPLFLYSFLI
jgi:hypothetical protein